MDPNHQSMSKEKLHQNKKQRGPPQVRQTLTSKYRMLKANPLLVHELGKKISTNKEESLFTPFKTLITVLDSTDSEVLSKFNISYKPNQTLSASTTSLRNDKSSIKSKSNKDVSKHEFAHPVDVDRKKLTVQNNSKKSYHKESQPARKLLTSSVDRNLNITSSAKNMKNDVTTGKSLTSVQKTKNVKHITDASLPKNKKPPVAAPLSHSQQNRNDCKEVKSQHNTLTKVEITSQIDTNHSSNPSGRNTFIFTPNNKPLFLNSTCEQMVNENNAVIEKCPVTPQMIRNTLSPAFSARRNSVFSTPNNRRKSLFVSKETSNEITQRLSEWLNRRGKAVRDYHHLKCFGIHEEKPLKAQSFNMEKENVENYVVAENNNFDKEAAVTPEEVNLSVVAHEALVDLHKLILDGYPPEQCQIWLKLIKQKCRAVEEEPQYWECRAALEQTKGNINLAVECYKNAIIQGAEVQNVDKCLDQLLQKFSLLNINNETESYVNKHDRNKIVQDARNIFKSSIIQFAVQEKVSKKKCKDGFTLEKKVVATPVRRSTRLSRSAFTSTPGIHVYSSLQEIDTSIRDNLNFQCNNALKE